ncbi:MAG: PP2C family protein-serine/threonine phosphatase [Bdellovibrionales bacterium]
MAEDLKARIAELEQQVKNYERLLRQANDKLLQLAGEIASDLDWALKIQKKLVPTQLPNIKGFEFSSKFVPGSRFGGDYFDIFEHQDKWRFGIFMSSCSGYTVSSALMGLLIKFSTQVEAKRGMKPHDFLGTMAAELVPSLKEGDRASLFYGVVDRKTLQLEYSSAGLISAYRQAVESDELEFLEPITPELTSEFRTPFQTRVLKLESQDRMLLASPGVVLAQNEKNEAWGLERMVDAWRSAARKGVHDLRNEILYQQQTFLQGAESLRDQSLIVIEVQEKIIKLA